MGPLIWGLDVVQIDDEVIRTRGHIIMHWPQEIAVPAEELKGGFDIISGGAVVSITDDVGTCYRMSVGTYGMRTPTKRPGEAWIGDELRMEFQSRWKPAPPADARVLSFHFGPIITVQEGSDEPARQFKPGDPVYEMALPSTSS